MPIKLCLNYSPPISPKPPIELHLQYYFLSYFYDNIFLLTLFFIHFTIFCSIFFFKITLIVCKLTNRNFIVVSVSMCTPFSSRSNSLDICLFSFFLHIANLFLKEKIPQFERGLKFKKVSRQNVNLIFYLPQRQKTTKMWKKLVVKRNAQQKINFAKIAAQEDKYWLK